MHEWLPDLSYLSSISSLHFLRPFWLLALIPATGLWFWLRQHRSASSGWRKQIDAPLLAHLLQGQSGKAANAPFYLLLAIWWIASIALAGPSWQRLPQPVYKDQDALVIVLDLSLSMLAQDVKPSRLTKARHKLLDILDTRDQGFTALVAYSGDAHIVSPLTDDAETIAALAPALSPLIMPAYGSNVVGAVETAQQLLTDGGVNEGRILLVTDGLHRNDVTPLASAINGQPFQLSILTLGSAEGAPIPVPQGGYLKDRDDIVIAKTNFELSRTLALKTSGQYAQLTLDDRDIQSLLKDNPLPHTEDAVAVERDFDQWREEGPWLALLILPFAALAFRRGWLFSVVILCSIQPKQASALTWQDLWQTPNQQAAQAFTQEQYDESSALFESSKWKGSAQYRAGDYEAAAETFAQQDNADAHYNRGNALAKAGKLDEAIKAYDQALAHNETMEDARENKALLEELKKQQPPEQSQDQSDQQNNEDKQEGDQQNSDSQGQGQDQSGQDGEENQEAQQDPQQSDGQENPEENEESKASDQQNKQQDGNENSDTEQDKKDKGQQSQEEKEAEQNAEEQALAAAKEGENGEGDEEQQQAMQQWLRRIPDDPGGLLKRKFDYQYRQRKMENQLYRQQDDGPKW